MNQFLIVATAFVSIYTLVLMALDRFLAVVFPISCKTLRTERNTHLAIALSWGLSFALSCPALMLHGLMISSTKADKVSFKICCIHFLITFVPVSMCLLWWETLLSSISGKKHMSLISSTLSIALNVVASLCLH